MKKLLDEGDKTDPHSLLRTGQAWLDLYEHAVHDRDTYKLLPGIYCLFSALEMHLKAYIVLKDISYADPDKLKTLMHKFDRMYEQITKVADPKLKQKIKNALDRYKLTELDINDLKYPKNQRFWHVDYGLEKGEHVFGEIFKIIEAEIMTGKDEWIEKVYPKKSHIAVLLHGEERPVSRAQAEKWLAMCPDCRPDDVTVGLRTSYPWHTEKPPLQICTLCGKTYSPDTMLRSSI